MGGDALFGYDGVFYTLFLLTPPRGGDKPGNTSSNALGFIFLLTPPRGGRQGYDHQRRANRAISTHAPAWGATVLVDCDGQANLFLLTPQNRGRTHRRGTPQAETGV